MQTTLPAGLRNRQVYYACGLYYCQLREGETYGELRPAISVCFLNGTLFPDVSDGHLSFSLYDRIHNVTLGDQLQLHLVELTSYNISEEQLAEASALEILAFFLSNAHRFDADQLRRLLPNPVYQKAIGILEMISREPELRLIYDDRAKEEKDKFSFVKDAREEGRVEGREEGKLNGIIQTLQAILGDAVSTDAELANVDHEALNAQIQSLQSRMRSRDA